jgi:hypothetical protein
MAVHKLERTVGALDNPGLFDYLPALAALVLAGIGFIGC